MPEDALDDMGGLGEGPVRVTHFDQAVEEHVRGDLLGLVQDRLGWVQRIGNVAHDR